MSVGKWMTFSVAGLTTAAFLAVALTPQLRHKLQSYFSRSERQILATASGDLAGDGSEWKVIKFRDPEGLTVEVFKPSGDGNQQMMDRILLPDKHDGLFNFQNHVTRLAIADIDHDGKNELLVPSFDAQLVPHLNVFRYNATINRFEPIDPSQINIGP